MSSAPRLHCILLGAALLSPALLSPAMAVAEELSYKAVMALPSANLISAAPMLVAPSDPNLTLVIRRIRIRSGASSTNPSYRFFANASDQIQYQTTDLTGCTYPLCYEILSAEGVKQGWTYDYDGLDVHFGPQERLYFYATADITSESKKVSIEVWYTETGKASPRRPSDDIGPLHEIMGDKRGRDEDLRQREDEGRRRR